MVCKLYNSIQEVLIQIVTQMYNVMAMDTVRSSMGDMNVTVTPVTTETTAKLVIFHNYFA